MTWLEGFIAQLVRTRGPAAVWEVAGAAAIAPYVVVFPSSAPFHLGASHTPIAVAVSLAFSLFVLASLRGALFTMQPTQFGKATPGADAGDTLTGRTISIVPDRSPTTGLPVRDAIRMSVEDHDIATGPALLGLIRFANHSAMMAFNPSAARGVMLEFGHRFEAAVGPGRHAAQIDEDTLGILFVRPESRESAESQLKSIAYVLSQEIVDAHMTVAPDIHAGSAWLASAADTFPGLLGAAQSSLAPLKNFGQARTQASKATPESLAQRFAIEQALRRAVREGQLSLRYQPFIDAASGRVAGAEALLRWRHPTLGDVSPTRFVPLLEETGLIHEIGLWTLNSACRQLREWRDGGQHDFRLAINLSAIQLQNRSLRPLIERTVASHGLVPADIELELTETAAMEDEERTVGLFQELRAQGFGIAIDDFGSGHSNLSYLKNLPFTKLKIDREFVSHVDTRAGSQAICKALVELGAGLGISVLAEGVERHEEVVTLRRLGCHVFQGFYFATPLTAADLTAKLGDEDWLALIGSDVHRSRAELQKRMVS